MAETKHKLRHHDADSSGLPMAIVPVNKRLVSPGSDVGDPVCLERQLPHIGTRFISADVAISRPAPIARSAVRSHIKYSRVSLLRFLGDIEVRRKKLGKSK